MEITVLVENTSISDEYSHKHGLSLFIKTEEHNILFDVGPDDTFIKNAEKLKVDLKSVDMVVLSHGHADHGGGLKAFMDLNDTAKIYVSEDAFGLYYGSVLKFIKGYVGIDRELINNERLVFVKEICNIDENLTLISKVEDKKYRPSGNNSLYKKVHGKYERDDFIHEQNLVVKENGKYILFAGCAHCGMPAIVEKCEKVMGVSMDEVIGGMHLFNPLARKSEPEEFLDSFAVKLCEKKAHYYTCHCTGEKPYIIMKEKMKDRLDRISTGQILKL